MTHAGKDPARFPLTSSLLALLAAAIVCALLAWATESFLLNAGSDSLIAIASLVAINFLAAAIGLGLVALVAPRGPMAVLVAYFIAASARFFLNILALVALLVVAELPMLPVVAALAFAFLPLLLVEAGLISLHLWRHDDTTSQATATPKSTTVLTEAVAS